MSSSKNGGRNRARGIVSLPTRLKIIGAETLLVGSFLVLTFLARSLGFSNWLPSVDSDLPIIGGALAIVGLEILGLARRMPPPEEKRDYSYGRLVSIRELVGLDLALHGRRFILLEFGIAAPALIVGGALIILKGSLPLGAYTLLLGFNYLPLLAFAVSLSRSGSETVKDVSGLAGEVRRHGLQQFLILVPFSIPVLSMVQRSSVGPRGGATAETLI